MAPVKSRSWSTSHLNHKQGSLYPDPSWNLDARALLLAEIETEIKAEMLRWRDSQMLRCSDAVSQLTINPRLRVQLFSPTARRGFSQIKLNQLSLGVWDEEE